MSELTEAARPRCEVCGNFIDEHWRGKPCMQVSVNCGKKLKNPDPRFKVAAKEQTNDTPR